MAASRCFVLLVTLAAALRGDYIEDELNGVLGSASGVMRPDLSWSKKCDPQAVDEKEYGPLVMLTPQEKATARYWDACPVTGKSCPSDCEPLASATSFSRSQKAFRWIGRQFSGACEKKCCYTDEYMLKPEHSKLFFGTSLAVLQAKLSKQAKLGCSTLASWLLPGCGVRQKKIFSLARFVFAVFHRLQGSSDCEKQLPLELRQQLSDIVEELYLPLEQAVPPAGLKQGNETSGMQHMIRLIRSGKYCQMVEKMAEQKRAVPTKDTEERLDLMVDAAVKSAAESGLEVRGASSLKESVVRQLKQERSAATEEQLFDRELKDEEDKLNQLLSQPEKDRNSTSLVQLGFDKAVVDSQGLVGVLMGIAWHLLFHGVFGTIFGAFSTAVCWLSWEASNDAGVTNINTWWKGILWIPLCAVQSFLHFWGITDGGTLFEDWDLS